MLEQVDSTELGAWIGGGSERARTAPSQEHEQAVAGLQAIAGSVVAGTRLGSFSARVEGNESSPVACGLAEPQSQTMAEWKQV